MALPDPQPAGTPTISQTEERTLIGLRSFLLAVLPAGTEVIKGQVNRVAEPIGPDFVVMTPLMQPRLGTNETTYLFGANTFVASVAGTTMTVYPDSPESYLTNDDRPPEIVTNDSGQPVTNDSPEPLVLASSLTSGTSVRIGSGAVIVAQLTGTPGGPGTYQVTPAQDVDPVVVYDGARLDLVPVEYVIQLDIHGPRSGDATRVIEGLFRSEYAVDLLDPYGVAPLYCSDPRQAPFVNDSNFVEYRWSMDAHCQANPSIGTPQEFMQEVVVDTFEVATEYTGPIV